MYGLAVYPFDLVCRGWDAAQSMEFGLKGFGLRAIVGPIGQEDAEARHEGVDGRVAGSNVQADAGAGYASRLI